MLRKCTFVNDVSPKTGERISCFWSHINCISTGKVEELDGIPLIVWTADNKIKVLKEFGCNCNNYNPYKESETPLFRDEKVNWF